MFQKLTLIQNGFVWGAAAGLYYLFSTRIHPVLFPPASTKAELYKPKEIEEINRERKQELERKGYPPGQKSPHSS